MPNIPIIVVDLDAAAQVYAALNFPSHAILSDEANTLYFCTMRMIDQLHMG